MAFDPSPSPEKLEQLLDWLDPDRDRASSRYLSVRSALTKIFETRGCLDADQLADMAIDRVMQKIATLAKTYEGDPMRYFYGVARNLVLESSRRPRKVPLAPNDLFKAPEAADGHLEANSRCLDRCMLELEKKDAAMIKDYYSYDKRSKAAHHVRLAEGHSLSVANLRVRVFRIRKRLRSCLLTCVEEM